MYPEVCARAREEVLAHVGPTRRPTYDDIRDMKYLRAVINGAYRYPVHIPLHANRRMAETMRLYPSVCVSCSSFLTRADTN